MNAPQQLLRILFALSTAASALVLVLFARGRVTSAEAFWPQTLAATAALTLLLCGLVFRRGRLRLPPRPLAGVLGTYLVQLLLAYAASALALTVLAAALVAAVTDTPQHALALGVLAGLWLALWVAPGVAAVTTWRRLGRQPAA